MEPQSASGQNVEIFICFALIAYIFYSLGSLSRAPTPNSHSDPDAQREVVLYDHGPQSHQRADESNSAEENHEESRYIQGFSDARRAFLQLGIHDIRREIKQENKEVTRQLRKKIEEMTKNEKSRQTIFEERERAMKGWREEQLDAIWREKQTREKSIAGWLMFGRRKRPTAQMTVLNEATNQSREYWPDEKTVEKRE